MSALVGTKPCVLVTGGLLAEAACVCPVPIHPCPQPLVGAKQAFDPLGV